MISAFMKIVRSLTAAPYQSPEEAEMQLFAGRSAMFRRQRERWLRNLGVGSDVWGRPMEAVIVGEPHPSGTTVAAPEPHERALIERLRSGYVSDRK